MRPRAFYVDVVRSSASVMVTSSHVFAPICSGMNTYSPAVWGVFNILDSIIRPSAALFIMISGKLFLGSRREDSYFQFVWRRYTKVFLPFFTWSMVYAFYQARDQEIPFSFGHAVWTFLRGPNEYHLWFMYIILALYLVMPAMRWFIRHAPANAVNGSLAVWMGFLIYRFVFAQGDPTGPGALLLSYGGYAMLGYVLDKSDSLHKKIGWCLFLWGVVVLVNAAATYLLTVEAGGVLNEKYYFGAAPLVAVQAGLMFLLLKNFNATSILFYRPRLRGLVTHLSQHSYNIYLNHALWIWLFVKGFFGFTLSHDTGPSPLIGVTLTTAAVLISGLGLSLVLQKIPFVSKFFVIGLPRPSELTPE